MTIAEFAAANGITITSGRESLRDGEKGYRYSVRVSYAGKSITVPYFCGAAYIGRYRVNKWVMAPYETVATFREKDSYSTNDVRPIPPQLVDVLSCLLCDSQMIESAPLWEDYAEELGLNVDSIREKSQYELACKQYRELRNLFGYKLWAEFKQLESE